MRLFFSSILLSALYTMGFAQSFIVGSPLEENLRFSQLNGSFDSSISFLVRPLINNNIGFYRKIGDSILYKSKSYVSEAFNTREKKSSSNFLLLPVSFYQQINTTRPYGWNDGAMIASKGYQALIRGGFYANFGPLSIQIQPEFVYATDDIYPITKNYGTVSNGIYSKFFPGQSSIRLNYHGLSLGLSTENLWWGPGINSSLLMSNNAPGFSHLTFNTSRPLQNFLGKFEWQLVVGKLTTINNKPYENYFLQKNPYSPTGIYNRYINGLVLTWQPKWVPGIFLGISRVFQQYTKNFDIASYGFFDTYLPVFGAIFKKNIDVNEQKKDRDQLISLFTRWLMIKANAEFYLEYGFNDHAFNLRDFTLSTTHSSAYIIGGRKIFNLTYQKSIEVGAEITQMESSPEYKVRNAGDWYEHNPIYEGYTNENQIMGAGSIKGNNMQKITSTYNIGMTKIGFKIERVQYNSNSMLLKTGQYWSDNSIGILGQNKFKKILISANLQFIKSNNYGWEAGLTKFNFHGQLVANYFW